MMNDLTFLIIILISIALLHTSVGVLLWHLHHDCIYSSIHGDGVFAYQYILFEHLGQTTNDGS